MDTLHAAVHVTCKGWVSLGRQLAAPTRLRSCSPTSSSAARCGAGRVWSTITDAPSCATWYAIGLDAVDDTLLNRLVREGRLPHLERLRARSATVALTSPVDFRAEAPWTEFVTGRRPSTLRYWTTVTFVPESLDAHIRGAPDVEPLVPRSATT